MTTPRALATPRSVVAMIVVTAVIVPVIAFPYLVQGRESSRLDITADALYDLLVAHVALAGVAIFLALAQLVPAIRRHRRVHRIIGRSFLGLGLIAFVGLGVPLAVTSPEGTFATVGLLIPIALWPVFAAMAWTSIRRRDVAAHRRWAIRLFALSWFAISARLLVPLLMLTQLPVLDSTYGGNVDEMAKAMVPAGQWLGWIVNLAVAEWILRRRTGQRTDSSQEELLRA